jgi:lipoprotein-anchoring transpeptidase ErfK/SrfK
MRCIFYLVAFALLTAPSGALAQSSTSLDADDGALHHIVGGKPATLFQKPDSTSRAYVELDFQEPVRVVEQAEDGWREVTTRDGARGFVRANALSNVWIRIDKREQVVQVLRGARLVRTFPADFGTNVFADKQRRGSLTAPDHWRTPEGRFFIVEKNSNSEFHRALVLNYPTAEDARHGLRNDLISRGEYEAITRADSARTRPPMDTALGGLIEIHGDGTGGTANWTHGCVALRNEAIDWLWLRTRVGTPVVIEP